MPHQSQQRQGGRRHRPLAQRVVVQPRALHGEGLPLIVEKGPQRLALAAQQRRRDPFVVRYDDGPQSVFRPTV
uniref:Hypothetical 8.2K protein (kan 5' region) n=1 Tax=Streptomyces griseus TaxID=1911 RepID=Q7M0K3_STRGR